MRVEPFHHPCLRLKADEHQSRRELRVKAAQRDLVADAPLERLTHRKPREPTGAKLDSPKLIANAGDAARSDRGGHAVERSGDVEAGRDYRDELFRRHFRVRLQKWTRGCLS